MLCSAAELGWAASAEGIVELGDEFRVGDVAPKSAPAPKVLDISFV